MALVNGGLFALYRNEEIHVCIVQKTLVLRNHWSDFEIISQDQVLTLADVLIARFGP